MKDAQPKVFQVPTIGGFWYSRGVDTTPPSAPTLLSLTPGVTTLVAAWSNGTDALSGIKSTYAEISPQGAGQWTRLVVSPETVTSLTFTGLTSAMPYDVRLASVDGAGNVSSYCATQTSTTLPSAADLEPGTISLAVSTVTVNENATISVAVTRTGAGIAAPTVEVDWAFSGLSQGTPSPANGTLTFPAATNGIQTIQTTAGSVTANQTGALNLVAFRALSGTISPSTGNTHASVSIVQIDVSGKKWPVGFFGGTNNITFPDDRKLAQQIIEQNEVIAQPNVKGWKGFYQPGCFGDPPFNFSKIFRDLNKLRAAGKQHMICLLPQEFGAGSYTDLLPPSVYNNSTYGASPTAGKYGWWTMDGGVDRTIAYWRASVMNGYVIPLFQALMTTVNPATGLTLDQDPFVVQVSWGETAMGVDSGSDYIAANMVTQYKALMDAMKNYATLFMVNNNFAGSQALSQQLTNYCATTGCVEGGPDTYALGQKGPTTNGLTWGQAAALGIGQPAPQDTNFQGPDLRGIIAMASDTQGPEISNPARYAMYTPHSFFTVVDTVLRQATMVITMINLGATDNPIPAYPADGPNTGANPGNWHSFLQVINGNTLSHIQVPSSITAVQPPPPVTFDYYIGPTGSDANNGLSVNTPWAITALNTKAATYAKKRVGILDGTYRLTSSTPGANAEYLLQIPTAAAGDSGTRTVIQSVNARGAVITSNNGSGVYPQFGSIGSTDTLQINCNFITVDGLTVTDTAGHGITIANTRDNVTVQNAHIYNLDNTRNATQNDTNLGGVYFRNSAGPKTNILVTNCKIHDMTAQSGDPVAFGDLFGPNGLIIDHCTVYNTGTIAYWKVNAFSVVVRYCYCYNTTFSLESWTTGDGGTNEVYGNLLHGNSCGGAPSANVNGNAADTCRFYNNTVILTNVNGSNPASAYGYITFAGGSTQVLQFYNNAVYLNPGYSFGAGLMRFPASTQSPLTRLAICDYNRYARFNVEDNVNSVSYSNAGGLTTWQGAGKDTHSTLGSLGLANDTGSTIADLTPTGSSALLLAGRVGGVSGGAAVDIGFTGLTTTPGCNF